MPAWGLDTAPEMFKENYGGKKSEDPVSGKIKKLVAEKKSKKQTRKQIVAMAKDKK